MKNAIYNINNNKGTMDLKKPFSMMFFFRFFFVKKNKIEYSLLIESIEFYSKKERKEQ